MLAGDRGAHGPTPVSSMPHFDVVVLVVGCRQPVSVCPECPSAASRRSAFIPSAGYQCDIGDTPSHTFRKRAPVRCRGSPPRLRQSSKPTAHRAVCGYVARPHPRPGLASPLALPRRPRSPAVSALVASTARSPSRQADAEPADGRLHHWRYTARWAGFWDGRTRRATPAGGKV